MKDILEGFDKIRQFQAETAQEHRAALQRITENQKEADTRQEAFWKNLSENQDAYWKNLSENQDAYWRNLSDKQDAFWKNLSDKQDAFWKNLSDKQDAFWKNLSDKQDAFWKKQDEKLDKFMKNHQLAMARHDEAMARHDEAMARHDEAMVRHDEAMEKFDTALGALEDEIGGLSKNVSLGTEEYYYRSLLEKPVLGDMVFDRVNRNVEERNKYEFDLFLVNGTCVAIVEVKHKAKPKNVKELIDRKKELFRKYFREFSNQKLYLGIASHTVTHALTDITKKEGVFLLTQKGGHCEVVNSDVREF